MMHKIILHFLFFTIILLLPHSEALAAAPPPIGCNVCEGEGSIYIGGTGAYECRRANTGRPTNQAITPQVFNRTPGCFVGQRADILDDKSPHCKCVPMGTKGAAGPIGTVPGPPPPVIPCTDATCTGGKGTRCNIGNGQPIEQTDPAKGENIGIYTAIGCVPTEPRKLIEGILKYGTFAAGGIAFIMMILAALQMITAEGNPESIKHAQESFYSAIIGLLLIIFSVLLMQVIGYDILGLSGFAR